MGPVHITITQPIFYILKKIMLITNNLVKDETFFKDTENYKPTRFYMDISGDIISLFGFFIYFEIIELKFCGLNYNLRKYIIQRARKNDLSIDNFYKISDCKSEEDIRTSRNQSIDEVIIELQLDN